MPVNAPFFHLAVRSFPFLCGDLLFEKRDCIEFTNSSTFWVYLLRGTKRMLKRETVFLSLTALVQLRL